MAQITDEDLQGEWFYLEEEQPFDLSTPSYYILRNGTALLSDQDRVHGSYTIDSGCAVISLRRPSGVRCVIALHSNATMFDETTEILQADATYLLDDGGDPVSYYGSFVRRGSDFSSTDHIRKRIKGA